MENVKKLETKKILSEKEIETLKVFLDKKNHYLKSKEKVLLHFDYEDFNIRAKGDKITGILDFGDLSSGPRAYDIARPFLNHYKTKKLDYFLKGYGKINIDEVKFYAVLDLVWLIFFGIYIKDKKNTKRNIKILKDLILN